jgi:hypothetical protein
MIGLIIRYVSLNIVSHLTDIISKPNIFTEIQTRNLFRICELGSCNLLAKANNFILCAILLSCFFSPELQKTSSPGLEYGIFFVVVASVLRSPCQNRQLWSWRNSFNVLKLQVTENTLIVF